jgi:hypothetical protein
MTPLLRTILARRKNVAVLLVAYREMQEAEQTFTAVAIHHEGDWVAIPCADELVSLCSDPGGTIYCLGRNGTVHVLQPSRQERLVERVRPVEASTGYLWRITRLHDGSIVCCGTFGEVYWRSPSGWRPLGSVRKDCELEKPPTFWALAGRSLDEVYAAGNGGRLFRFSGGHWQELESPTNYTLHDMICAEDGKLTACGESGTLVRGAGDLWATVSFGAEGEDLWSLVEFEGRIHVAGWAHIFREEEGRLVPLRIPLEGFQTKALAAKDGQLWSAGESFLCRYEAGEWTRLSLPP